MNFWYPLLNQHSSIWNFESCIIFIIIHEYTLLYFIFFKISMHGKVYNFKVSSLMASYIWPPFLPLFLTFLTTLASLFPQLEEVLLSFSIYCYSTLLKCNNFTRISLVILEKKSSYH
jgi:hypothetical protein